MARKIDNKGFTLLELIIVFMLISSLALVALVKFDQASTNADINIELHRLSTFLKMSRLRAFTTKQDVDIDLTSANQMKAKVGTTIIDEINTSDINFEFYDSANAAVTSFSITPRGLYSSEGYIKLPQALIDKSSVANTCIEIQGERVRIGEWDSVGGTCDIK